jgi:hypothetical protein
MAHRSTIFPLIGGTVCALALGACGTPTDPLSLSRLAAPALGDEVDQQHPEVMLLLHESGSVCTGTVIHVDADMGFLLTSARCVTERDRHESVMVPLPPRQFVVVPGTDLAERAAGFAARGVSVEPRYAGRAAEHDIAVVRFYLGGLPAPTAIPSLSPSEDALQVGERLLVVGYASTRAADGNPVRQRIERRVEALDAGTVVLEQAPCLGESDGAGLTERPDATRVAAVLSGTVGDTESECAAGSATATRVSAYQRFIQATFATPFSAPLR